MIDILNSIISTRQSIENNINNVTSEECEKLKLYEQLTYIEKAESAIRSIIKTQHEAQVNSPEMFIKEVLDPIII